MEIFGPEASGKTTLALHVISEAQKLGGYLYPLFFKWSIMLLLKDVLDLAFETQPLSFVYV